MANREDTTVEDDSRAEGTSIRTQTVIWPTSTLVTTWTLGTNSNPTESPGAAVPALNSNSSSNQIVGPILSAIVILLVFILVFWFCCRRNNPMGPNTRRSNRQNGSSGTSKSSSSSPGTSEASSRNGASVGSVASEMAEEQWDHQAPVPERPMPAMPRPAAGIWPVEQLGARIGQPLPLNSYTGFPHGRGGPPPMMGQGIPNQGGPPPIAGAL
ncbi:hypothetical protein F5Y11DRAFT_347825 [Daldinia sp. FL1419]|nr:hypothetical protein F5Y11DRAFT_347825 [Daldinia sp. FL1419]